MPIVTPIITFLWARRVVWVEDIFRLEGTWALNTLASWQWALVRWSSIRQRPEHIYLFKLTLLGLSNSLNIITLHLWDLNTWDYLVMLLGLISSLNITRWHLWELLSIFTLLATRHIGIWKHLCVSLFEFCFLV